MLQLLPGGVLLGPGGVGWGGFSLVGGICLAAGVSLVRGGSPWFGGVSLVPGGFSLVWGGSPWSGGVLPGLEGCLLGPGGDSPETLPPVNRITDTCKNITLATTSLRPVKKTVISKHQINKYLLPTEVEEH